MVKASNIQTLSYSILFLSTFMTLLYYYYIIKYIKKVKNIELCDKLNYPYLNIFYGIMITFMIILVLMFPSIRRLFGIEDTNVFSAIVKYNVLIVTVSLSINILIVKLLYDINNQDICKDISPNFRQFIFVFNVIGIISNFTNLYSSMTSKSISKKELKRIKKYLKRV
jgi:hypothetical protein